GAREPDHLQPLLRSLAEGGARACRRAARVRAALGARERPGRAAVRRDEAATDDRALARQQPGGAAARRADDRARSPGPPRRLGSPLPAQAAGCDARAHHALHGRSGAALRPARRDGPRQDRRGGVAAGADPPSLDARGCRAALRERGAPRRRADVRRAGGADREAARPDAALHRRRRCARPGCARAAQPAERARAALDARRRVPPAHWSRQFHAMLATPLRVRDLVAGHELFVAGRLAVVSAIYLAILAGFGAIHSPLALLGVPVAVLLGLAHAAPVSAFSAWLKRDEGFSALFRFGVMPMFLFSGTFFPVTRLPHPFREVAYATPLWHGVDLMRHLTLGTARSLPSLGHVAYLALWFVVGYALARRAFTKALVT